MELSLKDAISILDVLKTIDWYSITLWLSITIPLYYIALKKLIPENDSKKPKTFLQRLTNIFTMPKVESFIIFTCVILFIAGTVIAIFGQKEKERIRNIGWALKNHMINTGYYSMAVYDIKKNTGIKEKDIYNVTAQFPNEFSIVYNANGNPKSLENQTIILSDSIAKIKILTRSEKILASYLNNDAVLSEGWIIPFDNLFNQNNLFTYAVVYKLIADSGSRFSLNLIDRNNFSKGFGILKFRR